LEREIRRELTEEAEDHAVSVFARNLRSLLLQRPLRGRRVLAIDPGFRTGCKIAALDDIGNLLEDAVIYPYGRGDKGRSKGSDKRALSRPPANASATESPAPVAASAPTSAEITSALSTTSPRELEPATTLPLAS